MIAVNTSADEVTAGDGFCSLEEAIGAVDAPPGNGDCTVPGGGTNTIVLGAARYMLSRPPSGTDDNATGDLTVSGVTTALTISGAGRRRP